MNRCGWGRNDDDNNDNTLKKKKKKTQDSQLVTSPVDWSDPGATVWGVLLRFIVITGCECLVFVLSVRVLYRCRCRCSGVFSFFFFFCSPLNLTLFINSNRRAGLVMVSAQSIIVHIHHGQATYHVLTDNLIPSPVSRRFKVSMLRCQIDRN